VLSQVISGYVILREVTSAKLKSVTFISG